MLNRAKIFIITAVLLLPLIFATRTAKAFSFEDEIQKQLEMLEEIRNQETSEYDADTDYADEDSEAGSYSTPDSGMVGTVYTNPDTGYEVYMYDEAGLLYAPDAVNLIDAMKPITMYCSVLFYTTYVDIYPNADDLADAVTREMFGSNPGTAFIIDMDTRQLRVWSQNGIQRILNKSYGDTITDNVYRHATKGDYYECARLAFSQMYNVLAGQKISMPMKYISNALISLIAGFLITFIIAAGKTKAKKPVRVNAAALIVGTATVTGLTKSLINEKRVYSPQSSSSGGSHSHGGGGHGGGGHSGGGGGHGF